MTRVLTLALAAAMSAMPWLAAPAAGAVERAPSARTSDAVAAASSVQTFRNAATGRCLDAYRLTFAGVGFPCADIVQQRWRVHRWADGTRELRSLWNDECLAELGSGVVTTLPCDASTAQSWYVHRYPDGGIELKAQASLRCLDDSRPFGTRVFACGTHAQKSAYQTWY